MARQPEAVRRPLAGVLEHGLEVIGDRAVKRGDRRASRTIAAGQPRRRSARSVLVYVMRVVRSGHRCGSCARDASSVRSAVVSRCTAVRSVTPRCPNAGRMVSEYRTPWRRPWSDREVSDDQRAATGSGGTRRSARPCALSSATACGWIQRGETRRHVLHASWFWPSRRHSREARGAAWPVTPATVTASFFASRRHSREARGAAWRRAC